MDHTGPITDSLNFAIFAEFNQQIKKLESKKNVAIFLAQNLNLQRIQPIGPHNAFSAKIEKSAILTQRFWLNFKQIFCCWIQQIIIGSKSTEFSNEIQTHLGHMDEFFAV